jgi:hypothetical protein
MSRSLTSGILATLLGFALLQIGPLAGQEFKGQVKIGVHKVKLDANKVYEVIVESPKGYPMNLNANGILLMHIIGANFQDRKTYCMPSQASEVSFSVTPAFFGGEDRTTVDYALKIKGKSLAEKPVLYEASKWTNDDPIYKQRQSHYKTYLVKLQAGLLYIIDLVKGGAGVDPYLYLESPEGKIVAQDDDSGGNLNARIIYSPSIDGEFRIIATTLAKATGDFTLTVRQAE